MNRPLEPTDSVNPSSPRLETGLDVLERWVAGASRRDQEAVYEALFAMIDQSLFRTYRIVDDWVRLNEFFVLVRDDLVVKFQVHCFDSFGIGYVGPPEDAPGLVRTTRPRRASPPGGPAG